MARAPYSGQVVVPSSFTEEPAYSIATPMSAKDASLTLPSLLSYAHYRLSVNKQSATAYRYTRAASTALMAQLAKDYVDLLTREYAFKLVKTAVPNNSYTIYYLDYTGNTASLRPYVHMDFPGEVIIEMFVGYDSTTYISFADGLEYVETDNRTTVNFQNR